jgi:hypothetical protein
MPGMAYDTLCNLLISSVLIVLCHIYSVVIYGGLPRLEIIIHYYMQYTKKSYIAKVISLVLTNM